MRLPLTMMAIAFPWQRSDVLHHSPVMFPSAPFPQTMVLADAVMVLFPFLLNRPSAPYHPATVLADARTVFQFIIIHLVTVQFRNRVTLVLADVVMYQFPFPRTRPSAVFLPVTVLANAWMVLQFLSMLETLAQRRCQRLTPEHPHAMKTFTPPL